MESTKRSFDLSNGLELKPIILINELGEFPKQFQYTKESVPGPGARLEDLDHSFTSCQCIDNCLTAECPCNFNTPHYNSDGTIRPAATKPFSAPIFECSSALCQCLPSACYNDILQQGIQYQLQVFATNHKGFGVRSPDHIHKGRFICEYAGEIIGKGEAVKRASCQRPGDSNYILVLKEHLANQPCLETIVDPTQIGNVGRFLNHSCDPNLMLVPVRADHVIPKICLFAKHDILPYTELTYDYGEGTPSGSLLPTPSQKNIKLCSCEAQNCRQYLPFDPNLLSNA